MSVSGFGVPPPPPKPNGSTTWRPQAPTSHDVLVAIIVAVVVVVAGVPIGLLWAITTPKLNVSAVLAGSENAFNTQAGVDVHFALLALIFGVAVGALVGWRGRHGSWSLPLALAVGAVGGSLVAAQIGHLFETDKVLDQLPENVRGSLSAVVDFQLRSHGYHMVFPLAALVVYLLIVLATTRHRPAALPEAPEPERYWSVPR